MESARLESLGAAHRPAAARALAWWMRGVGAFYLVLAALNVPPFAAARLPTQYPGLDLAPAAARAIVDLWFLFGAGLGVVGAALLWMSRQPTDARALVVTVLWLEVVRGVAMDLYWAGRDLYDGPFYLGFAALHVAIIAAGVWALRRAAPEDGPRHRVTSAPVVSPPTDV